jgi:hypothetical protein
MSTQREKEDAYLSCKGDVCAGWLAGRLLAWESGEWILVRVESSDSRKRQKPRLAKPKRDFSIRRAFALSSHTHTHVEFIEFIEFIVFITEQRIRHRYLRQYLLAGLMHCCCFCWISGRRNGRRFVVCMSTCVCAAAIPVPDRSVLL